MQKIIVKNLKEAVHSACEYLPCNNASINICLTGGRFGYLFLKKLEENKRDIKQWQIFQTDERILCKDDDLIQKKIIYSLSKCEGFEHKNLNLFSYGSDYKKALNALSIKVSSLPSSVFDLTFLSLGEDGHIAGHFENSTLEDIFCFTDNAPKIPKNRISFSVKWLTKSKKLVLVSIGKEKKDELNKLINGQGLHSCILENQNLTIITDS
jgi:6-phosphogluconolactonase/Glucosamine-6-phosphate isomerase/deaminase